MGNVQSIERDENEETKKMREVADKEGPAAVSNYIESNVQRWKNEVVVFALTGCTATGKSTFINAIRGIKAGEAGFAQTGSGNTTKIPEKYEHPTNKKIHYCDLPGVGTIEFPKSTYVQEMKLKNYDFFFLFFNTVPSEDDLWLAEQLIEIGKPFCFVRSKIDYDISNAEHDGKNPENIISEVQKKAVESIDGHPILKSNKKIFIISSRDKTIAEFSKLLEFVEKNLDSFKLEAVISSLEPLSEDVIEKKFTILRKRIVKITVLAGTTAAIPIPVVDIAVNIKILIDEILHYIDVFGLSKKKIDSLVDFPVAELRCLSILKPGADMAAFVSIKLGFYATLLTAQSVLDIFVPIIGSIISGTSAAVITYRFLNGILQDVKDDALLVFRFMIQQKSDYRL